MEVENSENVQEVVELETEAEVAEQEPQEEDEIIIADEESATSEDDQEDETPVIRQMRQALREKERKLKELERSLQEAPPKTEAVPELAAKPTLEQFDYDAEAFESALDKWHETRRARESAIAKKAQEAEQLKQKEQEVLQRYRENAEKLNVNREAFVEAEKEVIATFDQMQQAVLLKSSMPERLVYALGRNSKRLDQLAQIKDPIDLAFELGRTEKALQVKPRNKDVPQPEHIPTRGTAKAGATLERLLEKARQTGDYNAYYEAKRAKK